MQTGQSTVKDVFDASRIFNIPIYQRAYSWNRTSHLPYFFNDLINQQADRVYFFGTLLFQINGKRGEFDVIDVIDGQQRMTTMVIFMNVLIGRMIELQSSKVSERSYRTYIKDEDVFKLELSNDDTSFLHQDILCVRVDTPGTINTESKRLMLEAKDYFIDCLADKSPETLERIFNTLTRAEVLLYVVKDISSATQIFELLNDRGKKLSDLESIKSFLMYNIGLVSANPEQLIKNIQEHFAAIYRLIEIYGLEDGDVLRYHTIAFEKKYEQRPKMFVKDRDIRAGGW
jgi:uncharacterized protein with ParB-like and HNH nuclease domain